MQCVELEILVFSGIFYIFYLLHLMLTTPPSGGLGFALMFLYTFVIYLLIELVLIILYLINRRFFKKYLKLEFQKWYKIFWLICMTIVIFFNLYCISIWSYVFLWEL